MNIHRSDCDERGHLADPMRGKGASKKDIDKIPVEIYREGMWDDAQKGEDTDLTCAICLCDYEDGDELRVIECPAGHHFHKACLDDWLVVNGSCPKCRYVPSTRNPPHSTLSVL